MKVNGDKRTNDAAQRELQEQTSRLLKNYQLVQKNRCSMKMMAMLTHFKNKLSDTLDWYSLCGLRNRFRIWIAATKIHRKLLDLSFGNLDVNEYVTKLENRLFQCLRYSEDFDNSQHMIRVITSELLLIQMISSGINVYKATENDKLRQPLEESMRLALKPGPCHPDVFDDIKSEIDQIFLAIDEEGAPPPIEMVTLTEVVSFEQAVWRKCNTGHVYTDATCPQCG